jgi:iron complex outermembrane recepter protein
MSRAMPRRVGGKNVQRVRRASRRLSIVALWALRGAGCAFAQPLPEDTASQVTVTGSTIRRIDLEDALPVIRISRDEVERSGATTLEMLLQRLPANVNAVTEANSVGELTRPGISSANLRGLGGGSTLVLLDGRRLANHAFDGEAVDLGAIPLAAIDRIEVLTDGASAIYGTDAIAGVINIILRRDFVGAQASAGALAAQHGGGAQRQAGIDVGTGHLGRDGYNVLAALHQSRQERLRATQRSFSHTAQQPDIGLDALHGSTFPANIIDRPGRRILNPTAASGCTPPTTLPFRPFPFRTPACGADPAVWTDLLPEVERSSALLRGTVRADAALDLHAEALLARSRLERLSSPMLVLPVGNAAGPPIYPANGPHYPSAFAAANGLSGNLLIAWRADELGPRRTTVEGTAQRYVVGAQGRWAGWDVDLAAVHSANRQAQTYGGSWLMLGRLIPALRTGLINPWGPSGPDGQALLASTVFSGTPQTADATTSLVSAVASGPLATLPAGPLMLGVGGELRRERLNYDWDPAVLLNGFNPVDNVPQSKRGTRQVKALHAELAWPVERGLDAQLAVRHDDYSDFGSSTNPKLALRWRLQPELMLRGAVGRGFRAPPLYALDAPPGVTRVVAGLPDPLRCPVTGTVDDCNFVVQAYAGGNPNLQPETSRQRSAGLLWQPVREWSLGVDLWRIQQEGVITPLTAENALRYFDRFSDRILRGPADPAHPTLPGPIIGMDLSPINLGTTIASGVDASMQWSGAPQPWGRWRANLQGTYVHRHDAQFDGVEFVSLVGSALVASPVPRWRSLATLDWALGQVGATLSHTYSAGYVDQFPGGDGLARRVRSSAVWDLQLRLARPDGWRFSLTIQNLLDRDPPASNQQRSAQLAYNPQLSNPLGRSLALLGTYAFR